MEGKGEKYGGKYGVERGDVARSRPSILCGDLGGDVALSGSSVYMHIKPLFYVMCTHLIRLRLTHITANLHRVFTYLYLRRTTTLFTYVNY